MTRDEIISMARKAGIAKHGPKWTCWEGQLELFAALVVAAQREACAKVCEEAGLFHEVSHGADLAFDLAEAIRAMGKA
jgi:hypothetical protein